MEDNFKPCHAYPLCRAHKCDCYENHCMKQTIANMKEKKSIPVKVKKNRNVDYGYSDDYATLVANNFHFYYGYEVEYKDEWCFQVSVVEKGRTGFKSETPMFMMTMNQIRKKLPGIFLSDARDFLLAGIGLFNEYMDKKIEANKKKKIKDKLKIN